MSRLPILMYHDIAEIKSEGLTISVLKLEEHFRFLAQNNYKTHHFKDLENGNKLSSKKNVIITFDDGFESQLKYAVPLLKKYNLKATFFITLAHIGTTDAWDTGTKPIMTFEMLHSLDPTIVELAYHSFSHNKYDELSKEEIEIDTKDGFKVVSQNNLPFTKILAYPYGKFPRKNPEKVQFIDHLKSNDFAFGLRIGNRVNPFPFKKPFEINRIDVKGEYLLSTFKRKLKWGRLI